MSRVSEQPSFKKLSLVRPMVNVENETTQDPLHALLNEFQEYELPELDLSAFVVTPPRVAPHLKDDQMWMTLEGQLAGLREGLQRLNYYLSDVDDSIRG